MDTKSELSYWVMERENIRIKKETGRPKPWTRDPILRDYKFCNVRREDDRVTKWIHENWLLPYKSSPKVAFAMCVARHFNWPDTLAEIGFPDVWEPARLKERLKHLRNREGKKIYTGAYMVSTCGRAMDKLDYSFDVVLTPLHDHLAAPVQGQTLESYWEELQKHSSFSSFMAGQVVADLKFIAPLLFASDWDLFAPLGPGSIRGLNRYFGRPINAPVKQAQGTNELKEIQAMLRTMTGNSIALHNVQNCMCEFDKYLRLKEGGKVRSKYPGAA